MEFNFPIILCETLQN